MEAYDAGQRVFAESRPQELAAKVPQMPSDVKWHFIGHLQTNKLKLVLPYVDLVQSVDSLHLLEAINAWGAANGRIINVLLELHLGAEETKQGFSSQEILELLGAEGAVSPTVASRPLPGAAQSAALGPSLLPGRGWPGVFDTAPSSSDQTFGAYSTGERTRSFLKVQDGCNNFCAYCTVPYARGRSRNIPICECVKMAREIAAAGVKEVVLTGVNTGDFGRTTGESFLDLLKALNDVEGIERFRISSIEPNLITPEIVDWIASGTKFQPHFHIPLQSGSDTLLRRVGRRYDTALFASRIDYIREAMERPGGPKVFFGIDVIVGLPGETEELFQETYTFLKKRIKPAFIHVFPYSRRPGTKAAEWKDQVKESVKQKRVAALEELCDQLHAEFVSANKGVREKVLWESSVKGGLMGGYTGNYIRLEKPFDAALVNTLEEVEI